MAVLAILLLTMVALPQVATAATREYVNGQMQSASFTYSPVFGVWLTGYYQSTTGYYAETDASHVPTGGWPKVGDVFYVHTVFNKVGGSGYTDVVQELSLPAGVQLAVGANAVRCYLQDTTGTREVTGTAGCPSNPRTGTGSQLNIALGTRAMNPNSAFEVAIPVRAMSGLTGLNSTSDLRFMTIAEGNQRTATARLYVPYATPAVSYPSAPATQLTQTSVRLNTYIAAHYTSGPVYFDVGTAAGSYTQTKHAWDVPGTDDAYDVWEDFTGLQPGTTYHWRVRYETGGLTYYGADQTFTTQGAPPVAEPTVSYPSPSATSITETSARLSANVVTQTTSGRVYFDLGPGTSYGRTIDVMGAAASTASVTASTDVTGLVPASTYHWRVRYVTGAKTITGADQTFATRSTTPAGDEPSVGYPSPSSSNIGQTSARLTAQVATQSTSGRVYFDLGPGTSYGRTIDVMSAAAGPAPVTASADVTGLLPATTYHWRVRYVTGAKTITGSDQTFTTLSVPASKRVLKVSVTGSGRGTVRGQGITCTGGTCAAVYPVGTTVSLSASAATGSRFAGWGGACHGTGACKVVLNSDVAVTASFSRIAAPDTRISRAQIAARRHSATFRFTARGAATRFECALVRKVAKGRQAPPRYTRCRSPKTYRGLVRGTYTFYVRAIGPGGTDRTPATRSFRI